MKIKEIENRRIREKSRWELYREKYEEIIKKGGKEDIRQLKRKKRETGRERRNITWTRWGEKRKVRREVKKNEEEVTEKV